MPALMTIDILVGSTSCPVVPYGAKALNLSPYDRGLDAMLCHVITLVHEATVKIGRTNHFDRQSKKGRTE